MSILRLDGLMSRAVARKLDAKMTALLEFPRDHKVEAPCPGMEQQRVQMRGAATNGNSAALRGKPDVWLTGQSVAFRYVVRRYCE